MKLQNDIVGQLRTACMQVYGVKPSKLSVLSHSVTEQWGVLVTYAVLTKRIVRRQSSKNPGRYWQVTSNVLNFVCLDSSKGLKVFNSSSAGLLFSRTEVLRINQLLKDGVNPLDKMKLEEIAKWSDKDRDSLSRAIWNN